MTVLSPDAHVADLVLDQPGRARVFERHGIDYCCGGRTPLASACAERGLDVRAVLDELDTAPVPADEPDWATASLAELSAHIVDEHHAYLREELPLLRALVDKVVRAHGDRHPELRDVCWTFAALADELEHHLFEEEEQVFPAVAALESGAPAEALDEPLRHMEHEHEQVAAGLVRLRTLTRDYEPPAGACNSYRSMLDRLQTLERDTHRHVHKENNILFPRARALRPAA